MIALVAGGTLNSSAANFSTAVNGVFSGTERLKGRRFEVLGESDELVLNLHFERQL